MDKFVPKSLHFYSPLVIMIGLILGFNLIEQGPFYEWLLRSEFGIIENLTVLYSFIAAVISFKLIFMTKDMPQSQFFKVWFILFTVALIYLGGEEASWGQHIFGWSSPQYFIENNQMNETNLHNLTPEIWPLVQKSKAIQLEATSFWYWVMPTRAVMLSCMLAFASRLWERYYAWMGIKPEYAERDAFKELKEVNETFLVLFMLIYLVSIYNRVKKAPQNS